MTDNPLQRLIGRPVDLARLHRPTMLRNGDLDAPHREDALDRMTSNPTIFEKALAEGNDVRRADRRRAAGPDAGELFELIETDDVRDACDLFAGVYERHRRRRRLRLDRGLARRRARRGRDGRGGAAAVEHGRPAERDGEGAGHARGRARGAPADRRRDQRQHHAALRIEAHGRVIEAYLAGLEDRVDGGKPIDRIASVASFFVSRVDTEIDKRLDAHGRDERRRQRERLAVAQGAARRSPTRKLAYRLFTERCSPARGGSAGEQGRARCSARSGRAPAPRIRRTAT